MKTSQLSQNSPVSNQNPEQSPSRILFGNTPEPWAMAMSAEEFEQLCFNISEARQGRFVVPPATIEINKPYWNSILNELKYWAYYEPLLGDFIYHRKRRKSWIGKRFGSPSVQGYQRGYIFDTVFPSHHLVWLWFNGEFINSSMMIDHVDQHRGNNRIENLRKVTPGINSRNAKLRSINDTGFNGVSYRPETGKYRARLTYNYKTKDLGTHPTAEAAAQAIKIYITNHPELGFTEHHGE